MQYTYDSGRIIKRLMPSFIKCRNDLHNELSGVVDEIYTDFVNGDKYYCEYARDVNAIVRSKENILYPIIFDSFFIPDIVRKFIVDNSIYQLDYSFNILHIEVKIRFSLFSKNELSKTEKYDNHVAFMCIWLYNCIKRSPGKTLTDLLIYIYPTKFKKKLPLKPADKIGVNNVNSAVTTRCPNNSGEIIIYREEEWQKVFIHETFHCFCFDVAPHIEKNINVNVSKLFGVSSKLNVAEAYCETWARIINAGYASYVSTKRGNNSMEEFAVYFNFSIEIEKMFSLVQMKKILYYQDIDFKILINGNANNKQVFNREDHTTNVFGYYVLAGILMNGYIDFIKWCEKHNTNLFIFPHVSVKNSSFVDLIKKCRDKEPCISSVKSITGEQDKFLKTTTRMSSIEVFY